MASDDNTPDDKTESVAEILADAGFRLLGKAITAARKFSRKKTEREQKQEVADWGKNHIPIGETARCAVCHQEWTTLSEKCPGPPASQKVRAELAKEGE